MNIFNRLTLIGVFSLFFQLGYTQNSVLLSSGSDIQNSTGSVSQSIGQLFYHESIISTNSLTEGIQQPFEIQIVSSIHENSEFDIKATVFPNPTQEQLTLSIEKEVAVDFSFQLFDINGKIIQQSNILKKETHIDMSGLSQSIYFLRLFNQNQEIKTFKIIKN